MIMTRSWFSLFRPPQPMWVALALCSRMRPGPLHARARHQPAVLAAALGMAQGRALVHSSEGGAWQSTHAIDGVPEQLPMLRQDLVLRFTQLLHY